MVKWQCLPTGFLHSIQCHIDHLVVQALVNIDRETQLLADRPQYGLVGLRFAASAARIIIGLLRVLSALAGTAPWSNFSEPMLTFVNALLRDVNLVDGLSGRIVDIGADSGLADAQTFLVDEFDEEAALFIRDGGIFFGHYRSILFASAV